MGLGIAFGLTKYRDNQRFASHVDAYLTTPHNGVMTPDASVDLPGQTPATGLQPDVQRPALPLDRASPGDELLIEQRRRHHRELPMVHPDRQPFRFDLRGGLHYFLEFAKDKEQTRYVFHVFECLPWVKVGEAAAAFLATERGQAVYESEPYLPDILDDHDALRRLPRGSFAHDYCDYMEAENLSAAGLVAEYEEFRGERVRIDDKVEWYIDRLRDTHDFLHILTGFGRDALGEQCVLAFVCKQRQSPGHWFLGHGGAVAVRLNSSWKAPVWHAVREARAMGRVTRPIFEESILELLALPTEAVRTRLNIAAPRYYPEVQRVWREEGIDANTVIAKKQAA